MPFCQGVYRAENSCLIPSSSRNSSTLVFWNSEPLSYVLDLQLIFILSYSNELLDYSLSFTFIVQKEYSSEMRKIINNDRTILLPPMLMYAMGPNKSICRSFNGLD
jgi:hypothetical protein